MPANSRWDLIRRLRVNDDLQKDPSNFQQSNGFAYRYMAVKIGNVMAQTRGKLKRPKWDFTRRNQEPELLETSKPTTA